MPSVIINGNVTDNVGVDYVAFETINPDSSSSWYTFLHLIPANMIDSNGDFQLNIYLQLGQLSIKQEIC